MKDWILSIGVTIIIITILSFMLPSGKLSNLIKSFFSILLMLVVLRPLTTLTQEKNFEIFYSTSSEINLQDNYLHFIENKVIDKYKKQCEDVLNKFNIKQAEITIILGDENLNISYIKKIYINLEKAVIISNTEHINIIDEIKDNISTFFNIENNKVEIYGYSTKIS